ncbi:unnamed protein product, partial [Didymodactylos carnosus]
LCEMMEEKTGNLILIDCRYSFEFNGGHIKDAINLYTEDMIRDFFNDMVISQKEVDIVFHCEFSGERGPKMMRLFRQLDREYNFDMYPKLLFPKLFLLDGGYYEFFKFRSSFCNPPSYVPMYSSEHVTELKISRSNKMSKKFIKSDIKTFSPIKLFGTILLFIEQYFVV